MRSVLLKPLESEKTENLQMYCSVVLNIFCMFPTGFSISKRMLEDVLSREENAKKGQVKITWNQNASTLEAILCSVG